MIRSVTILGLDPGLRHTGWGILRETSNKLYFVAAGRLNPDPDLSMPERLLFIADGIKDIIREYKPDEAAIEETFVNKNAASALKLGQARGTAMVALAQNGLLAAEYSANRVKQSLTGYGHADKDQIKAMIALLLPGSGNLQADSADALAVAVTHAHHRRKPVINFKTA